MIHGLFSFLGQGTIDEMSIAPRILILIKELAVERN